MFTATSLASSLVSNFAVGRRSFLFDAELKLLNTVQYSMGLSQGDPERRPVLSKVEARQGVTGHNVRYVLWFGLAAVIVAFSAIYFFYFD